MNDKLIVICIFLVIESFERLQNDARICWWLRKLILEIYFIVKQLNKSWDQSNTRGIQTVLRQILKKYFIYEIYKIIFLHSFHPIHNTSVSDVSIEKFRPGIFQSITYILCNYK